MSTLIKWGLRLYMALEIIRALGQAGHSSRDTERALDNIDHTRRALMNLTTSPNTAIRSANQSARNAARAQVPIVRSATTALLGTVGTDTMRIGSWTIRENEQGDLVGARESGVEIVLATNPDTTPDGVTGADTTAPNGDASVVTGTTVVSEATTENPAQTGNTSPASSWTTPPAPETASNAATPAFPTETPAASTDAVADTATSNPATPPIGTPLSGSAATSKHRSASSDANRN